MQLSREVEKVPRQDEAEQMPVSSVSHTPPAGPPTKNNPNGGNSKHRA